MWIGLAVHRAARRDVDELLDTVCRGQLQQVETPEDVDAGVEYRVSE